MAYTPPTYTPSGNLFGTTTTATPYTYGNLGLTSSDYSIWGSRGNPYLVAGPTYTPGSGFPINPQPIAPTPTAPVGSGGSPTAPSTGGDSDIGFRDPFNDTPFNSKAFGQLYPGLGLVSGLAHGRIDNPYGEGYARLPWYEGSAGDGYGYTNEGYDQYAPGDTDRGIYDAATGERTWGDEFDDYNTNDRWAQTSFFEGVGNIFGGRTWDGLEAPVTFGDPNSALAQQAAAGIASEKARVAANIAMNNAAAAAERTAAENPAQAAADRAYVGTAADGYAATAARYGTTPGSEQTAMLAEQDMGMSDSGGSTSESSLGGSSTTTEDAYSEIGDYSSYDDPSDSSGPSGGGDSGGGGGGSYIATAATQSLGEEGLDVFNNWRDYMHSWHPTFTTSFGRYRVTAPKIVAKIDSKENSKELYKEIWDEYLLPIHNLIISKDDTNALIKYKVMVKELMNKYLKGDK
ncbi:MAG: hypothetical protein K0U20_09635 [Proteobacteria bacterium]|nr:hypothetical protein [Pseudomonadota bacterium]